MINSIPKFAVRAENKRRVRYFQGIVQRLRLITVNTDVIDYLGDSGGVGSSHDAFEEVRKSWSSTEIKKMEENLDLIDYTLPGAEAIILVLGNRRLEHVRMLFTHEGPGLMRGSTLHS